MNQETKKRIKATGLYKKLVIPIRIRRIVNAKSFFPDYKRKSKLQRYYENYKWVFRFGKHNPSYNLFGLDVIGLRNFDDYMDVRFVKKERAQNHHEDSARAQHRKENLTMKYSLLADDKYIFYSFIESLNSKYVPTTHLVFQGEKLIKPFDSEVADSRQALLNLPDGKYICKANIGAFGDSIHVLEKNSDGFTINKGKLSFEDFIRTTSEEPYLVQDFIKQHESINKIYGGSVNTLRIISTRWNEETHILASMLRLGVSGHMVDNASNGGTFVGVDINEGKLMEYGYYYDKPREKCHPDTGFVYKDCEIPYWEEAISLIKNMHPIIFGLSTIGWDIAITENGPVIVEINWNYSIKGIQIASGGLRKRWEELKLI